MALALYDRVQQTGTANTTVSFTLSGSVTGFQSFAVIGNGNTTYYSATDQSGNWEVGIGTYATGGTLTRTTILSSSNSGSAVTFIGTVNVFVTYPSGKSVNLDASGNVNALGIISSGTWQGSVIGAQYGGTGVAGSLTGILYGNGTSAYTVATTAQALSLIGTLPIANGGSGATTAQTAINAFAGSVTSGSYLRGNGTNVVMSTIQAADVPTLNQNTTGSAATFTSTTQNSQFNSLGVGTAGSATTGEIRATNNITAFYSSDAKFKENIQEVSSALDIVTSIGSKTFFWTDAYLEAHGGADGYFVQKSDFGVIAQDVQKVFPLAVRTREDGTLAVDYEKLGTLAFAAIGQLLKRVEALEAK